MHAHRFSLFACAFLLLAACGDPTTEADDPGLKVCEGELALTCVDWGLDGNDRFACIEYACARPGEDPVDPAGASEDGVFDPIRRPVADFTRVHLSADEGADAGDDAGEGAGDAPAMDDEPADDGQESPADAPAAGADEECLGGMTCQASGAGFVCAFPQ